MDFRGSSIGPTVNAIKFPGIHLGGWGSRLCAVVFGTSASECGTLQALQFQFRVWVRIWGSP